MSGLLTIQTMKTEEKQFESGEHVYTSGQFAARANVTLRMLRYYDKMDLLKPSMHRASGARLYTDADFLRLQQILLLKYLGFSLSDIRELTLGSSNPRVLKESLQIQKRLLLEKQEELSSMIRAVDETTEALEEKGTIDWNDLLHLIHLSEEESELKSQYQNASNINARIALHRDYSTNPEGWFHWLFQFLSLSPGMRILELGCGNGDLWTENLDQLPEDVSIVLSDSSEGMVHEVKRKLGSDDRFSFGVFDMDHIPFADSAFDAVIANHVLFYSPDIDSTLQEIARVMKPKASFYCSTYGHNHMKEITQLVQRFNPEIRLSSEALYEVFGLENGKHLLSPFFSSVTCYRYEDSIDLHEAEPLISYILSCHGNQNRLLLNHYKEFSEYVQQEVSSGFEITKDAGLFIACF